MNYFVQVFKEKVFNFLFRIVLMQAFRRLGLPGHIPNLLSLKFVSWDKIYKSSPISETCRIKEKGPIQ